MWTHLVLPLAILSLASTESQSPRLTLASPHHNFGKITSDQTVSHSFTVSNQGKTPLTILDVKASCGCTSAVPQKRLLLPGEKTDIQVLFDPRTFRGPIQKSVEIHSDDPERPVASVSFEAQVLREIIPEPDMLLFTEVQRGTRHFKTMKLASHGDQPWRVQGIDAPNAPFIRISDRQQGTDVLMEVELDAGKVDPAKESGRTDLVIHTTNPRHPEIHIPVIWELSPTIVNQPKRIAWVGPAASRLTRELALSHHLQRPFRIRSVTTTHPRLKVEGIQPLSRPLHVLGVSFQPNTQGTFNESITFHLDDAEQSQLVVHVVAILQ